VTALALNYDQWLGRFERKWLLAAGAQWTRPCQCVRKDGSMHSRLLAIFVANFTSLPRASAPVHRNHYWFWCESHESLQFSVLNKERGVARWARVLSTFKKIWHYIEEIEANPLRTNMHCIVDALIPQPRCKCRIECWLTCAPRSKWRKKRVAFCAVYHHHLTIVAGKNWIF